MALIVLKNCRYRFVMRCVVLPLLIIITVYSSSGLADDPCDPKLFTELFEALKTEQKVLPSLGQLRAANWSEVSDEFRSNFNKDFANFLDSDPSPHSIRQVLGRLDASVPPNVKLMSATNRKKLHDLVEKHIQKFGDTSILSAMNVLKKNKAKIGFYPKWDSRVAEIIDDDKMDPRNLARLVRMLSFRGTPVDKGLLSALDRTIGRKPEIYDLVSTRNIFYAFHKNRERLSKDAFRKLSKQIKQLLKADGGQAQQFEHAEALLSGLSHGSYASPSDLTKFVQKNLETLKPRSRSRALWSMAIQGTKLPDEVLTREFGRLASIAQKEGDTSMSTQLMFAHSYYRHVLGKKIPPLKLPVSRSNDAMVPTAAHKATSDYLRRVGIAVQDERYIPEIDSHVDIFFEIGKKKYVIEVDGDVHDVIDHAGNRVIRLKDQRKAEILEKLGYEVHRIRNEDVRSEQSLREALTSLGN